MKNKSFQDLKEYFEDFFKKNSELLQDYILNIPDFENIINTVLHDLDRCINKSEKAVSLTVIDVKIISKIIIYTCYFNFGKKYDNIGLFTDNLALLFKNYLNAFSEEEFLTKLAEPVKILTQMSLIKNNFSTLLNFSFLLLEEFNRTEREPKSFSISQKYLNALMEEK